MNINQLDNFQRQPQQPQVQQQQQESDIVWLYQAGADPMKEKDSTRWQWQLYPKEISAQIEQAIISNQTQVEYEHYEIDLQKMIQFDKQNKMKARRIKREIIHVSQHRLLEDLVPVTVKKEQKTASRAFGNVRHFLNYIMKRTPEGYHLYQKLNKLKLDCLEDEYKDIVDEVKHCIQKAAETKKEVFLSRKIDPDRDYTSDAVQILEEIDAPTVDKSPKTLKYFLRIILRIYTLETFVYAWLNELLRSENWEEINVLTPYLVCLTFTFQLEDYILVFEKAKGLKKFLEVFTKAKLTLYRGTALTEDQYAYYDMKEIDYFSWNAVTSTSRDKNQAHKFVNISVNNAIRRGEKRIGVLFEIDTDYASVEDCEGMIDVSKYSKFPGEEEIILVPGTVFRLVSKKQIRAGYYQINLEIKKKFDKDQKEINLLGALQQKVIFKELAVFDKLQKEEILLALGLLEGNQLIRKLDIKNSIVDSHLRIMIEEMRRTTPYLKKENFRLINNTVLVQNLRIINEFFSPANLAEILENNNIQFDEKEGQSLEYKKDADKWKVRNLVLRKGALERFARLNTLQQLFGKLSEEDQLSSIEVIIESLDFGEQNLLALLRCFQSLPSLKELAFKFKETKFNINNLAKILGENFIIFPHLQHISLDFTSCSNLTDEAILIFSQSMPLLTNLNQLSLNFDSCYNVSDQGVKDFSIALKTMNKSLQNLSLNFSYCKAITNETLNYLTDSILDLKSLTSLAFNFYRCENLSDIGLQTLSNSLPSLPALRFLDINFCWCANISDESLNTLSQVLKSMTYLENLALNFDYCPKITDQGLISIGDALILLTSLKDLALNFSSSKTLADEGATVVSDKGFSHLTSSIRTLSDLSRLSLRFYHCEVLSNVTMNTFSETLKSLVLLKDLSMDLEWCENITDEALTSLSNSLKSLTALQSLNLNFDSCYRLTNQGFQEVKDSISLLKSLVSLSLNFSSSTKIADAGLNSLPGALYPLEKLQQLNLKFCRCKNISDLGLRNFAAAIQTLPSYHHLTLKLQFREKT